MVDECAKPANYDRENNDMRTLYVHVVSNGVIFPQISFNIVPYALHFLSIKLFPQVHYLNKLCIQLLQNVTWTDE